ncbi:LIM zinc-binding domain-containing Nebulette isoform X1 [Maylandia zebra]|uniref:LIM and SH3 domain protein 1 n=3 Tax=Haplochromini TaxID=319058 RepID=A0A3B4EZC2_9CICH|nr:PREDICTED: LIM and SH3 domain protein 1-like isoform X1 [Pundamilia nyererei]XP_012776105.1 LIM and SH3 domain protein 1 isoform X1 [Maylandia zebra]XP_026033941.1 LIM and SH3 domain protein 1-like isoform X1 [Astatotilapia calliptera]XP_039870203.1 LIM and SH3 domain protein 1-like isoform X1 [Simochromis diagramma]
MNPPCGRCNKPVYPTEKINCLDKYWHKGCFSCEVCKMALSMTNYKGFEKKPYCTMHYPKTSFTIVTDTPENLRLKQQSMLNSQALYKEEFEKNKGKGFSAVADTPEMQRVKKTQDQISNALYKEEFEKNKGKGFSVVVDTPEMQRVKKTQDQISNIKYHEEFEKSKIRSDAPPPENRQDYEDQPSNPVSDFGQSAGQMRTAAVAPHSGGKRYQAMYSYMAAEADELSLQEGDLILDVEPIDEGWVFGFNQRTGQRGMLPANYVRPV